jgi:hypothetical protein
MVSPMWVYVLLVFANGTPVAEVQEVVHHDEIESCLQEAKQIMSDDTPLVAGCIPLSKEDVDADKVTF